MINGEQVLQFRYLNMQFTVIWKHTGHGGSMISQNSSQTLILESYITLKVIFVQETRNKQLSQPSKVELLYDVCTEQSRLKQKINVKQRKMHSKAHMLIPQDW